MTIVAIANQKGGVGKTTTAVNLSSALAEAKKQRVLLVDMDPQANATSGLGIETEELEDPSIYECLVGDVAADSKILRTRFERLDITPADRDMAGAEGELAQTKSHLARLHEVLQPIRLAADYDFVFLDCPPSLGVLMTSALAAADQLLIPLQCEFFGLEGLAKIMSVLAQIRDGGINPNVFVEGIIMTMYDQRTNLSRQVVDQVREHFPDQVYNTIIPRSVRLGEAPSFGQTIHEYAAASSGAAAYRDLAKEFMARQKVEAMGMRYQ